MEVEFIPATEIYKTDILRLQQDFYAIDHYKFDLKLADFTLGQFLLNPDLGRIYLIKVNSLLVGYVILTFCYSFEFGGRIAFLDELYLEEGFRNRGIGFKTLTFIQDIALTIDIKVLHLEAERHNLQGKALYHKFGFQDHDRHLLRKNL